jgi:hypothetical protein
MDALARETLCHVLGMLPAMHIMELASTCKSWRDAVRENMGAHLAREFAHAPRSRDPMPRHALYILARRPDLQQAILKGEHLPALCTRYDDIFDCLPHYTRLVEIFPTKIDYLRPLCLSMLAENMRCMCRVQESKVRALLDRVCTEPRHRVDLGFAIISHIASTAFNPSAQLKESASLHHGARALWESERALMECVWLYALRTGGACRGRSELFVCVAMAYVDACPSRTDMADRGAAWVMLRA